MNDTDLLDVYEHARNVRQEIAETICILQATCAETQALLAKIHQMPPFGICIGALPLDECCPSESLIGKYYAGLRRLSIK